MSSRIVWHSGLVQARLWNCVRSFHRGKKIGSDDNMMDKAIGLVPAVERHDWKPALWKLLRESETLMIHLLGRSWAEAEEALHVLSKKIRAHAPNKPSIVGS